MQKILFLLFIPFLFTSSLFAQSQAELEVQAEQLKGEFIYLGNYYGKQTFLLDSAKVDNDGEALFENEEPYPPGIYFLLPPQKNNHYDFLIDKEAKLTFSLDTSSGGKLSFNNAPENTRYQDYLQFLEEKSEEMADFQKSGASEEESKKKQGQIQQAINAYRTASLEQFPESLMATIFNAMKSKELPEALKQEGDQEAIYRFTKEHYWDYVDFRDSALVRTPLLEMKLERYFDRLVPPLPDSINQEADRLLAKTRVNQENFKVALWWLTSTYERSTTMGMDAVFVHLAHNYYAKGDAYWLSQDQAEDILSKAARLAPNLIGNTAPDITLQDTAQRDQSLSKIQSKYIVLAFWDPTCSHCKVVVPELNKAYREGWKEMGVKIVGVLADGTEEQWREFIKKEDLSDWIHLRDARRSSPFRQLYNVYQTPIIYLLDSHKKIKAKNLSVENTDAILKELEKREKE